MDQGWGIGQGSSSDDKGPMVIAAAWLCFVVATAVLLVRFWIRICLTRLFGWDDIFMILALAFGCVHSAFITVSVDHGLGTHQADLSKADIVLMTKYFWLSSPIHDLAVNWGKVSAMLLLVRIIDKAKSQACYFYAGMFLLTVVNTVDVFIIVGQCRPVEAAWNPAVRGRCWDKSVVKNSAYFQSACCCFSDLVLAGYPVIVISNLQMPSRMKITLSIILSLSLIAFIAPVMKAYYIARVGMNSDYSWKMADLAIWGALKHYLVIITASIPTLAPLAKHAARLSSSGGFKIKWWPEPDPSEPPAKSYKSKSASSTTVTVSTAPSKKLSGICSVSTVGDQGGYRLTRMPGHKRHHSQHLRQQQGEMSSSKEAILVPLEHHGEEIMKVTEMCVLTESNKSDGELYWTQRVKPWEVKSPV